MALPRLHSDHPLLPTPILPPDVRKTAIKASSQPIARPFAEEASGVIRRLRAAVLTAISSIPGRPARAADLQRALDLDTALAWQLRSFADEADIFLAVHFVPKGGAMHRFLTAARDVCDAAAAGELELAYAEFLTVVERHAGDRQTFDAMVAALRPSGGAGLEKIRKTAFKANAAVWGVTCRVCIKTVAFHQRPSGEFDAMALRGRLGLYRLQENAAVSVYASGRTWGGSSSPPDGSPRVATDTCEFVEDACSHPLPVVTRLQGADGSPRDFVQLSGIGKAHAYDLFWRNHSLNFPGGSRNPPHGCTAQCLEPSELLIADLLVPKGWCDPRSARVVITPESSRFAVEHGGEMVYRLPFEGRAEYLGNDLASLATSQAPGYAGIVAREIELLGWTSTPFEIVRCEVPYPALFSAVHLFMDR